MPEAPRPRWRLDAVALILFAAGTALAVCVGTYRPLTGIDNPLGPAGDDLAGWLVNALGVGATVLLVGWFALAALYAARRSWSRLLVRAAGWVVLTVCAAVMADYLAASVPTPASAFGKGGSVGAYLRFALDDHLKPPLPALALAFSAILGLVLAADGLVRAFVRATARGVVALGRWAGFGNTLVARVGDRLIAGLARAGELAPAPQAAEVVPLAPAADPPITRHTELPDVRGARARARGRLRRRPGADPDPSPDRADADAAAVPRRAGPGRTRAAGRLRAAAALSAGRPGPVPGRRPRADAPRPRRPAGKDLRRLRPRRSRWSASTPARSSRSTRSRWTPACGSTR